MQDDRCHRVCRWEGEETDAGRQGYVTGYAGGKARRLMQDGRCHRVCRWEGEGPDAGRQGYVTGYAGGKARRLMQDDRGTSQGMLVGRRGDR